MRALASVVCVLALQVVVAAAGVRAPAVFEVDPEHEDAPELSEETWTREGESYAIHLTRIDDATRLAYIERFAGVRVDPFAVRPDSESGYMTFLVEIENRGDSVLPFNAQQCWLMTNAKQIERPVALSDLSFSYRVADIEFPPAYRRVGPAILDDRQRIQPGGSTHGLLIYRAVEPKTKRFHVDVPLVLPSGDAVKLRAPYRRSKPARKQRTAEGKRAER